MTLLLLGHFGSLKSVLAFVSRVLDSQGYSCPSGCSFPVDLWLHFHWSSLKHWDSLGCFLSFCFYLLCRYRRAHPHLWLPQLPDTYWPLHLIVSPEPSWASKPNTQPPTGPHHLDIPQHHSPTVFEVHDHLPPSSHSIWVLRTTSSFTHLPRPKTQNVPWIFPFPYCPYLIVIKTCPFFLWNCFQSPHLYLNIYL